MLNFHFTFCILLITLSAYAQENREKSLKNTSWVQQGYGRSLKIEDSTYIYYNTNSIACKALADGKLSGRFSIVSLTKDELTLNPGGIVNYIFKRVDSLPPMCTNVGTNTISYEKNFKVFWETFHDNYAFFKERNINWKQVYEEYLPRVRKINAQKEFAVILLEIVKKIGDGHIRLEIPDSLKTKVAATTLPVIRRKKDDIIQAIKDTYLADPHTYNNGVINWGKLKGSQIGYILIKDMNNFAKDYDDKIKDSKQSLAQFADELNGVDQVMKNTDIKTMGSRTAGIFSEILWKELPNGWEFSLSNEIYTDPKGKTYEGTGVPVSSELNYSRNRLDFYNSFYSGDRFTDKAIDQILIK